MVRILARRADRKIGGASRIASWWFLPILALVVVGIRQLAKGPTETPSDDPVRAAEGGPSPLETGDVRPGAELEPSPAPASADLTGTREGGDSATRRTSEVSDVPRGPVIERAYLAAKAGRWRDAVRWLDEDLASAPPGTHRDLVATLRAFLLMEHGSRLEGALALASLLSDASAAMAKGRFGVAEAPDPNQRPEARTIFAGEFAVAAPDSGWWTGGSSFFRFMHGHAKDSGRHDPPLMRTEDGYLASLAPFVTSALADVAVDDAATRQVLEATRAFIELNERIRRRGGDPVLWQSTAPLEDEVVSFFRTYGSSVDPRVQAFGRFLFAAFPGWSRQALEPPRRPW